MGIMARKGLIKFVMARWGGGETYKIRGLEMS